MSTEDEQEEFTSPEAATAETPSARKTITMGRDAWVHTAREELYARAAFGIKKEEEKAARKAIQPKPITSQSDSEREDTSP